MEEQEHGYVYAIGYDGEIKIGISAYHPNRRLTQMQSGNSRLLELLGTTYVQGYKVIERLLHRELKTRGLWIRGEWYKLSVSEARDVISGVGEDLVMKERERVIAVGLSHEENVKRQVALSYCRGCGNRNCIVCGGQ